ncbi:Temperature-sensitive hemagglutinin tsh autotransporter precursor [Klebsiella pneumoniae]|nr:Temperature-sensitive hemagglutinin tsh autotransporter precursor [Klebsiella pneumoniae]
MSLIRLDLFTGIMGTYTDTDVSAGCSVVNESGGLESMPWPVPSGAYFDLIANIYTMKTGMSELCRAGKQNFRTHSLYAGAEAGIAIV